MKEHPIIFSGPMVLALLAGRKSVTRRLSKQWLKVRAGDRLWVRETWQTRDDKSYYTRADTKLHWTDNSGCADIWNRHQPPESFPEWIPSIHMPRWASRITLEAQEDARVERLQDITGEEAGLEGIQIPVVRVQNPPVEGVLRISGKNAPVKFFPRDYAARTKTMSIEERTEIWLRAHFASLWDDLHTKPGERWEDNPEVVRVGPFKVL